MASDCENLNIWDLFDNNDKNIDEFEKHYIFKGVID